MERPVFDNVNQAVTAMWGISASIARGLVWLWIVAAHLVLAVVIAIGLWWWQVTPAVVGEAFRSALEARPVALLSALGLSAFAIVAAYGRLLRWVHRRAGSMFAVG